MNWKTGQKELTIQLRHRGQQKGCKGWNKESVNCGMRSSGLTLMLLESQEEKKKGNCGRDDIKEISKFGKKYPHTQCNELKAK